MGLSRPQADDSLVGPVEKNRNGIAVADHGANQRQRRMLRLGRFGDRHDNRLDRTTTGHGYITDVSLAELKQLDAGSWFDPAFRNERVPTLDEVFELVRRREAKHVLIAADLKGTDVDQPRNLAKTVTVE